MGASLHRCSSSSMRGGGCAAKGSARRSNDDMACQQTQNESLPFLQSSSVYTSLLVTLCLSFLYLLILSLRMRSFFSKSQRFHVYDWLSHRLQTPFASLQEPQPIRLRLLAGVALGEALLETFAAGLRAFQ